MVSVEEIADRIESVLPKTRPINHHEPFIDIGKATVEIIKCLTSGIQDYKPVEQFEEWIRNYTGAKYALATNSGTSALHLALLTAGINSQDEVIVPTTTFVATANAVSYVGAIPHFIDSAPNIDPNYLRTYLEKYGRGKITAIIVVHLFGIPADIESICEVAKEFDLTVIEDACQALGSTVKGRHVGTFGNAGIFSFNGNKILTTGNGGGLVTNSPSIYHEAKKLCCTARISHKWLVEHDRIAWNYRMGSLNASIGLSQNQDFKKTMEKKIDLYKKYRESLGNLVEFVEPTIECSQNHWLTTILVENRNELLEELHSRGIKARASFTPLNYLGIFNSIKYQTPLADRFFQQALCLPSGQRACNESSYNKWK